MPRLIEGAGCSQDDDCATNYCDPWARNCQRRCNSADECQDGEYCNGSSRTCLSLVDDGGGCEDHEACRGGNCRADERCGPPPAIGDACGQSYECYPLGFCEGGECAQRKSSGQACSALDSCLEPMLCVSGKCKMMNLECKPAPVGKMCAWLRVCADNAYCDVFDGFVCKPKKLSGQECFRAEDCADDLRCVLNAEQTGLACAARLAAGEVCSEGSDCADGLFCIAGADDTRTCGAGPAGQPCDAYEPDMGCPAGYFCNDDEQCQAPGGDGADCYYEQPCLTGFYCDTSTCRAQLTEGASCSSSDMDQCAAGLYCGSEYVCAPRAGLDAECESWPEGQCQAGLVCEYIPEETLSRCRAGAAIGEDCYDDDCASGICHEDLGCVARAECTMP